MSKRSIRYTIFILIVIGAGLIGLLIRRDFSPSLSIKQSVPGRSVLRSGSLRIPVTIASTPAAQQQGLSGTPSLPANAGMLFAFTAPGNYGFWMKDMHYALDFIWMNANMQIVDITPNVAASTYPQVFYCSGPACPNDGVGRVQYVLEVNAGFSTAHDLMMGQTFTLSQ